MYSTLNRKKTDADVFCVDRELSEEIEGCAQRLTESRLEFGLSGVVLWTA